MAEAEEFSGTQAAQSLGESLRRSALEWGADFYGVANLTVAREAIVDQGGEMLAGFPRALSLGIAMPPYIVDQLPHQDDARVAAAYRAHSYDILNRRLDGLASRLNSVLQREGFQTFPVPASWRVSRERLLGHFSHKMAAHLAGLGWIGRSCLLITPEVGPRVRWATVLTDAPLETGSPMPNGCGDCRACVDICPASAFSGRRFVANEPRSVRFDVFKCRAYQESITTPEGGGLCGMCVYVCPHGQKNRDARLCE